jgi:hypothetical protein
MAEMKLQQAVANSLSKNETRWIAVNREVGGAVAQFVLPLRGNHPCELEHLYEDLN